MDEVITFAQKLCSKGKSFFKSFGERVLVHIVSLVMGIWLAGSLSQKFAASGINDNNAFIFIYLGLICLFPRGNARHTGWLVPSLIGFATIFLQVIFGAPWQLAIFWGGVQTWILRAFFRRWDFDWEWTVLPVLLMGIFGFTDYFEEVYSLPLVLGSLGFGTLMGILIHSILNKKILTPKRRKKLEDESKRIESFLLTKLIPLPLQNPLKELSSNALLVSRALPQLDDSTMATLTALGIITNRLSLLIASESTSWKDEGERLLRSVNLINDEFSHRLRGFDIQALDQEEERIEDTDPRKEVLDNFYRLASELARKKAKIPEHLHPLIDNLRLSARKILDSMRKDPMDYQSGEKFLRRYLTAVHKILDNYIYLQESRSGDSAEVEKVLNYTEEVLVRLEKAFRKEFEQHLRNETMDLKADLSTLDTLLRLDGR